LAHNLPAGRGNSRSATAARGPAGRAKTTYNPAMGEEIISIVNAADQVVGTVARAELRRPRQPPGLIYRVNYILLFNRVGWILAQRRAADKDLYPGRIDLAAGGVLCAGEDYAPSAARELAEELGVSPPLIAHFDLWFEDALQTPARRNWGRVFSAIHDGPFELQQSEVASAEFMPVEAALALPAAQVTPDTRQALVGYLM